MCRTLLILSLVCVAAATATNAHAKTAWLGAQIAFPLSGHDVAGDQLGINAGATLHMAEGQHVGPGLDIAYHYFPTSAGYKSGFDRYLRLKRLAAIDGPDYAFKAIQITPHLRVTAPLGERWAFWAQIGAGAYLVDRNLGETDWTTSYAHPTGPGFAKYTLQPGWNTVIGIDTHSDSNITVGIDATYHQISSEPGSDVSVPTFHAITAGMHVLFGW